MNPYVHHTRGRLRIKSPLLKRNTPEAAHATRLVGSQEGVLNCTVNTVTGSMLIRYEQTVVQSENLLRALVDRGYVEWPAAIRQADRLLEKTLSNVGELVMKSIATAVLEQVAQRSALALMRAIRWPAFLPGAIQ